VVGDAAEDIGEPGLRIDAIEFGYFDQRLGNVGTPFFPVRPSAFHLDFS